MARLKINNVVSYILVVMAVLFCSHVEALYAFDIKELPANTNEVILPKNLDICLNDNLRTAEIKVNSKFSLNIYKNGLAAPEKVSGRSLNLKINDVKDSKPAKINYYCVLKTFPYSYILRDDKKNEIYKQLNDFESKVGKLVFFTYGAVLKSADKKENIDIRSLFAAYGPFSSEEETKEFGDNLFEKFGIKAFCHPVRIQKPSNKIELEISYAAEIPETSGDRGSQKKADIKSGAELKKTTINADKVKLNIPDASLIELFSAGTCEIKNMEFGRGEKWHNYKNAFYSGKITINADNTGLCQIINNVSLDELLKTVVPSEIEPKSPYQAICAQAVAARTEILAKFETRHTDTDYDFCAGVHCQAYGGLLNRRKESDRSVEETSGYIITSGGHIIDAVYHANCGGVTEDSNKIWSAPYDPSLISVSDEIREAAAVKNAKTNSGRNIKAQSGGKMNIDSLNDAAKIKSANKNISNGPDYSTNEAALEKFIKNSPQSYCSGKGACDNPEKYRWEKVFSEKELTELVKKQLKDINKINEIKVLGRGKSGRMTGIEVVSDKGSEKIYKELNIRKLFGMLRSGLFIIERFEKNGISYYKFSGAGWGHGVGMCQDGAKGMALCGKNFIEILMHYFSNSRLLKFN